MERIKPPREELAAGAGLIRQITKSVIWTDKRGKKRAAARWLCPSDVAFFTSDWERVASKLGGAGAVELRKMAAELRRTPPTRAAADGFADTLERLAEAA